MTDGATIVDISEWSYELACPTCGLQVYYSVAKDRATGDIQVRLEHYRRSDDGSVSLYASTTVITEQLAVWSAGSLEQGIADAWLHLSAEVFRKTKCVEYEEKEEKPAGYAKREGVTWAAVGHTSADGLPVYVSKGEHVLNPGDTLTLTTRVTLA